VRYPRIIRQIVQAGITSDAGLALSAPFRPRCASILFMHRFAMPDLNVEGHSPQVLRARLEYLRRHRYNLMSLTDLIRHIDGGIPLKARSVVFTVDDGYADFARVGAPAFAAYDCPVTVFLITDFVSGRLWNWFDKVAWAVRETPRSSVTVRIGDKVVSSTWRKAEERFAAGEQITECLKRVSDAEKEDFVARLPETLDVSYPERIPVRDRAMDWDEVRSCANFGVTFGPHTMTHPILSQVDQTRAEREISGSWRAVAEQTKAAVPVFCYPNGTVRDFSDREAKTIAAAGMKAALSTIEASLVSNQNGIRAANPFALPRFNYPETDRAFIQIVSGLEALRQH
jgi:peptidoglycan/xylan/chitin deacetylase (PgdA/CDA1 family)